MPRYSVCSNRPYLRSTVLRCGIKIIIMYAFLSCGKVVTSEAMGHGSTGRVHVIVVSVLSDNMRQIEKVSLKPRLKFE